SRATRRTSRTSSPRSRSSSSTRSSGTERSGGASSRSTTRPSPSSTGLTHAYHLYVIRIDAERAGGTRDEYQRLLAEENIATSIHFLPVHELTAYRELLPDQPPL